MKICFLSGALSIALVVPGGGSVNGDILSKLLAKRIRLTATTLRARPIQVLTL